MSKLRLIAACSGKVLTMLFALAAADKVLAVEKPKEGSRDSTLQVLLSISEDAAMPVNIAISASPDAAEHPTQETGKHAEPDEGPSSADGASLTGDGSLAADSMQPEVGSCVSDVTYDYAQALRDGVLRECFFFALGARVSWLGEAGERHVTFEDALGERDQARRLRVFGGSGPSYEAAFGAATRRARAAMGDSIGGPIERVQAVRSRPQ